MKEKNTMSHGIMNNVKLFFWGTLSFLRKIKWQDLLYRIKELIKSIKNKICKFWNAMKSQCIPILLRTVILILCVGGITCAGLSNCQHAELIAYVSLGVLTVLLCCQSRIKFYPIWLIIIGLGVATFFSARGEWEIAQRIALISLGAFLLLMWRKPMNIVYGLIGTKGDIRMYVFLLVFINLIFSGIYYYAIFKDAGITYDINQPYISYGMFNGKDTTAYTVTVRDTSYSYDLAGEQISYTVSEEKHNYQKVEPWYVLKNTFMTSLMQEPSDFFAIASTYNQAVDSKEKDIVVHNKITIKRCCKCKNCKCKNAAVVLSEKKDRGQEKSELFHWLLILQVFISWIFFGVFISILYNKFRYES